MPHPINRTSWRANEGLPSTATSPGRSCARRSTHSREPKPTRRLVDTETPAHIAPTPLRRRVAAPMSGRSPAYPGPTRPGNRTSDRRVKQRMRPGRSVLVGLAAGVVTAAALILLNLLVGPPVCVSQPVCTPPAPGQAGCGPVPEKCSGTFVSASVIVMTAVLIGAAVAAFLALRGRKRDS